VKSFEHSLSDILALMNISLYSAGELAAIFVVALRRRIEMAKIVLSPKEKKWLNVILAIEVIALLGCGAGSVWNFPPTHAHPASGMFMLLAILVLAVLLPTAQVRFFPADEDEDWVP
jgi:hypothetical protein